MDENSSKPPLFRWMLAHPNGMQTFFKVEMDKNTAIEFMKGLYKQVNNGELQNVSYEFEMQGFLDLYKPIKPIGNLSDNNTK